MDLTYIGLDISFRRWIRVPVFFPSFFVYDPGGKFTGRGYGFL